MRHTLANLLRRLADWIEPQMTYIVPLNVTYANGERLTREAVLEYLDYQRAVVRYRLEDLFDE